MPAEQIVTNQDAAKDIMNRLVDPREIEAIILATTQDQSKIEGYTTDAVLVISLWAAVNKTCYDVLQNIDLPDLLVRIGPGSGADDRASFSNSIIKSIIDSRPIDKSKVIAFVQSSSVPQYPPMRSGPSDFWLLTVCGCDRAQKHEIRLLDKNSSILPEYSADGRKLVEFRLSDNQTASRTHQKKWWEFWK